LTIVGTAGTGKTTVAKLVAKYLYAYNVLASDVFIEKNGLELKVSIYRLQVQ
jgi:broad-specificity NMP kinase